MITLHDVAAAFELEPDEKIGVNCLGWIDIHKKDRLSTKHKPTFQARKLFLHRYSYRNRQLCRSCRNEWIEYGQHIAQVKVDFKKILVELCFAVEVRIKSADGSKEKTEANRQIIALQDIFEKKIDMQKPEFDKLLALVETEIKTNP
jgi:hypothetical protein